MAAKVSPTRPGLPMPDSSVIPGGSPNSEHLQNCHVDYLAFTIYGFEGVEYEDMLDYALMVLRDVFGPIPVEVSRRGWRGYEYSLIVGGGLVAFGGNNGTMYFDLPGEMCSLVTDWDALAQYLDDERIKLKRIDIANDDVLGETLSIEWAREAYQTGGFKPSRGMSPMSRLNSDEGSGAGSTYYVGSRKTGKICRIYEKGKQLGDKFSRWVRFEVEWRDTHRHLSIDMLRDPTAYLAASYPCAAFIGRRTAYVKTVAFNAAASIDKAREHAKKQAGGYIKAAQELGLNALEIIAELVKPQVPPRLVVSVENLIRSRKEQKPPVVPACYKAPTPEETHATENRLRFELDFWRSRWGSTHLDNHGVISHAS